VAAQDTLNRMLVVVGDLHLGAESCGALDEFKSDEEFHRLLTDIIPNQVGCSATLCLNGDFVDFTRLLRPSPDSNAVQGSEELAVLQLKAAVDAHPIVFAALRQFVERGGRVVVIPGNHDVEFLWPAVFEVLRKEVAADKQGSVVRLCEGAIQSDGVLIEHGHQLTWDNSFRNWPNPIVRHGLSETLEKPWGNRFMDLIYRELPDFQPYVYSLLYRQVACRIIVRSFFDGDGISRHIVRRILPFLIRTFPETIWRRWRRAGVSRRTGANPGVIVRGHTHVAEDRVVETSAKKVRLLNPGSWLSRIQIDPGSAPHFHDLDRQPRSQELKYVVIDRENLEASRLCALEERSEPTTLSAVF